MKYLKIAGIFIFSQSLLMQQAFAQAPPCGVDPSPPCAAVPEMDGPGAIVAIGLVIGLAALFREKFFRK